jgi:cyclopropane-fatty-acyl-phospholipid synthase
VLTLTILTVQVDRKDRKKRPVTDLVEVTNDQLYANDPAFFLAHLGPKLKYSACEFPTEATTLAEAEELTLRRYQDMVGLDKLPAGARVLELGCGWGSLSLTNAARFPHLQFTSFSNSPPQIEYNRATAKARGLTNITFRCNTLKLSKPSKLSNPCP